MSSSNPSSSEGATPTSIAPLALTTPFIPPRDCSHWTTTSVDTSWAANFWDPIDVRAALVSSDNPSCYPSGAIPSGKERRLYFSPGVCPSGWTYYRMATIWNSLSSAWCCQSGFTYQNVSYTQLFESSLGCFRSVTDTNGDGGVTLFAHEAWNIGWVASETSILSPEPPALTSSMLVPTWTPGEVIPDGVYDRKESGGSLSSFPGSLMLFIMVGIPIIAAVLIGSCIFCCARASSKKRHEKKVMIARTEATATGASLPSNGS